MRVLTVGSLPPEWGGRRRGGVATFHAALLAGLLERRARVEVVGTLPPEPLGAEVSVPVFACPDGVGRADFYADLLERLHPDLVLMNHVANTVGVTHGRLRSPIPAIGVVHSWHNITFAPVAERPRALAKTQEALDGLSAMVAPSLHALSEGRELGFRYPAVAEAIHNPLPLIYMDEGIDVHAHGRRGALYLGGLIPRKDPAALVDAATLFPTLEVLLVGEGELEAELRLQIEQLGIGDRVRLAGRLPEADHLRSVRNLLLRSRAVCLPSRSESFGLVFIEALACGTPIVGFAPTVREIADAMGVDVGEPVEGGGRDELAAALERVLARRWDRRELREAALAAFGLPRIVDRYLDLFGRVVPAESARGAAAG